MTTEQRGVVDSGWTHWVVSGPPRSGKSTMLVERLKRSWGSGLDGGRALVLVPDRRAARQLNANIGPPPDGSIGRLVAMSYHSFVQDLIRRWWPVVVEQLGISAPTPEFLPFNLAQFACLNEYRSDPGNLQRLTIREQRLIVQVLSNMNLSAANGLSLDEGWRRVALGIGASPDDDVIRDGADLTHRFRRRCIAAGVLPVDLQVEAAGLLLEDDRVRNDLTARFDVLAIDGLDEFVPLLARHLVKVAESCEQATVVCSDDGGLRWLLGASARTALTLCDEMVERGRFRLQSLDTSFAGSGAVLNGSSDWLARAVAGDPASTPASFTGWKLHDAKRPDEMAKQVAGTVTQLVREGVPPTEIALLIPYMDTLISTELERQLHQRDIPFRIDRRWQSLLDDPQSRACLTALRCVNPGKSRKATLVEVADLLVVLTETNPVVVQHWARALFNANSGTLREPGEKAGAPREVRLLGRWGQRVANDDRLHWQLETLARHVFAPHASSRRRSLIQACYALANEARRFTMAAPRLHLDEPYSQRFFDYVDSNVVAADSATDAPDDAVLLTTPYAFLTSGRTAHYQCWLNVASPSWWEPPLLLLTNPHAMSGEIGEAPLTYDDDDRIRGDILGRMIRNLAARCDGEIHTFASFAGVDGEPLDGPLYDCLVEMRGPA